MRLAITGAAGFIGSAMAARACERGDEVVGLDLVAQTALDALGARSIVGDLLNDDARHQLVRGAEEVLHTAAIVKESGDPALFQRINVEAALAVAESAKRAGVRRFFHLSSVMVYGFDYPDHVAEDGPLDGAGNPYCATKIEAERRLLALHEPGRFDVYLVRPGDVYGPGSIPWTLRPFEMLRAGKFMVVDGDRALLNHVYVDNLLDGIDLLRARNASGRAFNVTDGRRTTTRAFFGHYAQWLGVRLPNVPAFAALAVARASELLLGRGETLPEVNRHAVRYLLRRGQYSTASIRALGFAPRVPLERGMELTRAWLTARGHLS